MPNSDSEHQDSYHDDPIESQTPKRQKAQAFAALVLFAVGGFYLQSTLAANLSVNSATPIEFGQGISQTTACSGEEMLTITPKSIFSNTVGGGSHYLSSITVSNIPSGCSGKDFTINAYDDSDSSALSLFAATSKNAVIYDNAGVFEVGTGGTGLSITTGDGTFTITFDTPVAVSTSVFKLTMQSGAHTPVIYVPTVYTYGWTSLNIYSPSTYVWGAAASQNGSKLIVGAGPTSTIYRSVNSGTTWAASSPSPSKYWRQVASSLDGSVLAGIQLTGGYIWISEDSGNTWTSQSTPGTPDWQTVAVSGNGSVILAAAWNTGAVWTRNSGTWNNRTTAAGTRSWSGASASTNGTSLALVDQRTSGYLYTSSDSGATWVTRKQATGSQQWNATSMSGDGTRIALTGVLVDAIYVSSDSGATWTSRTGAGSETWAAISMSTDGSKIVAADSSAGLIWLSSDYGATWSSRTGTGNQNWLSVALSGSGNVILGGTNAGYVWVGTGT
jgi:hypothetical protein